MKRLGLIFKVFLAVVLINLTTTAKAQESHDVATTSAWTDSIDVSLLTCGPGDAVWSYYGHTALRIHYRVTGEDIAVNWGMFSFGQDYFVLRFVFGLTDYQMGITTMQEFLAEYASRGRWVKEQVICLSPEEKQAVLRAIEKNYRPENREYRYNFFYDNCTTRARDIILAAIGKENYRLPEADTPTTFREEIHKWNEHHRWARFGNDLLLGYQADQPLSTESREFLPINLLNDFDLSERADFLRGDTAKTTSGRKKNYVGTQEKLRLVASSAYLVSPQAQVVETESITPLKVAMGIALVIVMLCGIEVCKKRNFWWLDVSVLVLTGLPGLILLAMVFSQHPTVQVNLQILVLNPLNLVFAWMVGKRLRKGGMYPYYQIWACMLVLFLLLGLRGTQVYAEGMSILALSLLIRFLVRDIPHARRNGKRGWPYIVKNS